jgi:hypothetical protein
MITDNMFDWWDSAELLGRLRSLRGDYGPFSKALSEFALEQRTWLGVRFVQIYCRNNLTEY